MYNLTNSANMKEWRFECEGLPDRARIHELHNIAEEQAGKSENIMLYVRTHSGRIMWIGMGDAAWCSVVILE